MQTQRLHALSEIIHISSQCHFRKDKSSIQQVGNSYLELLLRKVCFFKAKDVNLSSRDLAGVLAKRLNCSGKSQILLALGFAFIYHKNRAEVEEELERQIEHTIMSNSGPNNSQQSLCFSTQQTKRTQQMLSEECSFLNNDDFDLSVIIPRQKFEISCINEKGNKENEFQQKQDNLMMHSQKQMNRGQIKLNCQILNYFTELNHPKTQLNLFCQFLHLPLVDYYRSNTPDGKYLLEGILNFICPLTGQKVKYQAKAINVTVKGGSNQVAKNILEQMYVERPQLWRIMVREKRKRNLRNV